ncbi:MAG TPA: phosphatase PAP2 family protein [Mycobacteriales bacterium]|nr:phosphatase PAP2 family protein [Mycobacteriales bacterium]
MAVADSPGEVVGDRTESAHEQRWRLIRRWAAVAYFLILILFCILVGVPQDRQGLLLWTVAGLGIRCLGRGWRSFGRVLLDWLPFTAALVLYDYSRGFADQLGIATHVKAPASIDRWMFGGTLPTAWMQQHFYVPGDPQWYDVIVTLVYTSHFLTTPIVAVILWIRNRDRWKVFIGRIIAMSFLGLAVYVLYPAAPPWFASRDGYIEPVARMSARGWYVLHMTHAGNLLNGAQAGANAVAAMPSLHTATATIVALYFMPRLRWWGKCLVGLYPVAMGTILVYSAEHYVIDLLAGAGLGLLVTGGSMYVERRLAARKRARSESPAAVQETLEDEERSAPVAAHLSDRS